MKNLSLIGLMLTLTLSSISHAGTYVGASAGVGVTGDTYKHSYDSSLAYGVQAGETFLKVLGLGLYYQRNQKHEASTSNLSIHNIGVDGTFHLPLAGLYAGAKVGLGHLSATSDADGSASKWAIAYGPQVGWDFSLVVVSVGFNLNYLMYSETGPFSEFGSFSGLGVVKLWL